jgi:ferredoxin
MVKVDQTTCIGCGTCAQTCGEVFEIGEDGKSHVKKDAKGNEECIEKAIEDCPVDAISA